MQKGTKNKDDVRYRLRGWSFFKKKTEYNFAPSVKT